MSVNKTVEHLGIVSEIKGSVVKVKIESQAACNVCHAKNACFVSDKIDKIIEIETESSNDYSINENVKIILKKSDGLKAIFLSYVIPLFIVVFSLIILSELNIEELKAGIFSILFLIPYYLILYLLKKQLKNNFTFELMKLSY